MVAYWNKHDLVRIEKRFNEIKVHYERLDVESIKQVTDPEGQVVLEERYLCYVKWQSLCEHHHNVKTMTDDRYVEYHF